jgi:hypothetical protein
MLWFQCRSRRREATGGAGCISWGAENHGYIISRRVPCAGCNILYDPEECGKGFACIVNITPEEVLNTVMKFL